MGDNLRDVNYADFGSSNCNILLEGCSPDQSVFLANSMLRFQQRAEGESCYGTSGTCAPGLYCNRSFQCARLPWDPAPTYPAGYIYNNVRGPLKPGPATSYWLEPKPMNFCDK